MADQKKFNEVVTFNGNVTHSANVAHSSTLGVEGIFTLGNTAQAVGTITGKLDTGILNVPCHTVPDAANGGVPHSGARDLDANDLISGLVLVTAGGAGTAVKMPARTVIKAMFGGEGKIAVGDCFEWTLMNTATNAAHYLTLTVSDDGHGTVPANQAAFVASTVNGNGSASPVGGNSSARFLTRVTNVEGNTKTVRLH